MALFPSAIGMEGGPNSSLFNVIGGGVEVAWAGVGVLVGNGVNVEVGVTVGVSVGKGVGVSVGSGVGVLVGVTVGLGVGLGVRVGVGLGVRVGVGLTVRTASSSVTARIAAIHWKAAGADLLKPESGGGMGAIAPDSM